MCVVGHEILGICVCFWDTSLLLGMMLEVQDCYCFHTMGEQDWKVSISSRQDVLSSAEEPFPTLSSAHEAAISLVALSFPSCDHTLSNNKAVAKAGQEPRGNSMMYVRRNK